MVDEVSVLRHSKDEDLYWERRLRSLLDRGKLCACGCGEPIQVSLEWLLKRGEARNVWLPKYCAGHTPLVACACGCGKLIESVDSRGRPRKVLDVRHAARMASSRAGVDWEKRASEWNAKAPYCACGCGVRLHRTPAQMRSRISDAKFLQGHSQRRCVVRSLTNHERSVILGLLLGDFSISVPHKTPRLAFTHGIAQKTYALHKMEILSRLKWWWQETQTSGYTDNRGIQGSSSCTAALEEVYCLTRPGQGRKTVSQNWLEQLDSCSLAYWMMDDGSVSFSASSQVNYAALHTEGFTEGEQDLMVEWFRSRGFLHAQKKTSRGYWYLYFPRVDALRLIETVRPYFHDSMLYKLEGPHGKAGS